MFFTKTIWEDISCLFVSFLFSFNYAFLGPNLMLGKSAFSYLWFQSIFRKNWYSLMQYQHLSSICMCTHSLLWCVLHSLLTRDVCSWLIFFWAPGCELFGHVNFKMFNDCSNSSAFLLPVFKTEFWYHCDFQMYDKALFLICNEYSSNSSFFLQYYQLYQVMNPCFLKGWL